MDIAPETNLKIAIARLNSVVENDNAPATSSSVFSDERMRSCVTRHLKALLLAPLVPALILSLPFMIMAVATLFLGIVSPATQSSAQIVNIAGSDVVLGILSFIIGAVVVFTATIFILLPVHFALFSGRIDQYFAYLIAGLVTGFVASGIFLTMGPTQPMDQQSWITDQNTQLLMIVGTIAGGILGLSFRYFGADSETEQCQ